MNKFLPRVKSIEEITSAPVINEQPEACLGQQNNEIDIVDLINKLRQSMINDFLDEQILIAYLSSQYKSMELSASKMKIVKDALTKLRNTPTDLTLYKPILEDLKANGKVGLSEGNDTLFYNEIDTVLKKYICVRKFYARP